MGDKNKAMRIKKVSRQKEHAPIFPWIDNCLKMTEESLVNITEGWLSSVHPNAAWERPSIHDYNLWPISWKVKMMMMRKKIIFDIQISWTSWNTLQMKKAELS